MKERAWALLQRHRRTLLMGGVLMLLARAAVLAVPWAAKFVYDDVIAGHRPELLLPVAGLTLALLLTAGAANWALTWVVGGAAEETVRRLRQELHSHVLRLPLAQLEGDRLGALVPRIMTDPAGVSGLVGTALIHLVGGALTVVVGGAVLFYLNWRLTLGTLVLLAAFGTGSTLGLARLRRIHREVAAGFAALSGRVAETLAGVHTVRASGMTAREERLFGQGARQLERGTTRTLLGTSLLGAAAAATAGAISVVLMVVGGNAVLRGNMTPGELLWFAMTMAVVARPLGSLAAASAQLTHAAAGLDRIAALLALPEAPTERTTTGPPAGPPAGRIDERSARPAAVRRPPPLAGEIVFEAVSYAYEDGLPVLRDVSLRAAPGTLTVVLGPNGAGKTTLLHLLLGLREPTSGTVRVDGYDLRDVALDDYRRQVGFMLQDCFLLHGTIRENIAYGTTAVSDAQVRRAAEEAGADDFIRRLPRGYDTFVGERGARLSAGQRQRVALARAVVAEPRILLLDEPTASLDRPGEAAVLGDLLRCRRGRTTLLVTHRGDVARHADQVLVLDHGRLVPQPRPERLRAGG